MRRVWIQCHLALESLNVEHEMPLYHLLFRLCFSIEKIDCFKFQPQNHMELCKMN